MSPSGLTHHSVPMSHIVIHTVPLCRDIFPWGHTQGMRRREARTANTNNHNVDLWMLFHVTSGGWLLFLVFIVHISGGQHGVYLQFFTPKWLLFVSMANQINRLTKSVTPLKEKTFTIWFSLNKKKNPQCNISPHPSSDVDEHLSTWKTWAEGHHSPQKVRETLTDWKELCEHTNRKDNIPHAPLFTYRNRAELCVPLDRCPSQYSLVISSPTKGERGEGGANCFDLFWLFTEATITKLLSREHQRETKHFKSWR